ncbi:hypothetical protein SMKI_05G1130 [Saccharomyces mikatae IFO 1815]|uniref:Uncharacterized protein n=1 Tax=Saccharomyces mikatae IFO 1815 TaxID=226126 RepID=A0AA35IYF5_SACMI|nr:uncharacterized protein SMKI_05G1130 [Saccharomyces mikatae IFO 1815]CAI4038502.1 hypothetical protein SMKI_05G1130 [Saccharomyces mikatae IFO 1815]
MISDTKHSSKAKIFTKKNLPPTMEYIRPSMPQISVPPAQNLPNGEKPNFGRSTKQRCEPRKGTSRTRRGDEGATMVTVNIDSFLCDKAPKKKSSKNKKKKSRHHQNTGASIDAKPHAVAHTVFAGASFTTDIPHEAALPKPSFV